MAAQFDTHQLLTGKTDSAVTGMACAAAISSVNARTRFALAGGSVP
jgi:hypothetical protein